MIKLAESIDEKHIWIRQTKYYGEPGNLKTHLTFNYYRCEKCGMTIDDKTYEDLLKKDK